MKLNYLESFRGFMSLWVVLYHASGFFPKYFSQNILSKLFYDGVLPVLAFVILSGFVTHILLEKRENFSTYIYRRFLRLFPIYLVAFIISLLMLDFAYYTLENLPTESGKAIFRMELIEDYYTSNKFLNIFSHLTLFHGLFPNHIYPFTYTIMGQSWSLTLEWQFYLFIPVVFWVINKRKTVPYILLFVFIIISYLFSHYYMPQKSFLPYMLHYFLIGFFSYSLYKKYRDEKKNYLFYFLSLLTIIFYFENWHFSVMIIAWGLILYYQVNSNKISDFILQNKFSLFLGKISYSLYCLHMIVLYIVAGFLEYINITNKYFFISLFIVISLVLSIILSKVSFDYIESPFISLGRKKTKN